MGLKYGQHQVLAISTTKLEGCIVFRNEGEKGADLLSSYRIFMRTPQWLLGVDSGHSSKQFGAARSYREKHLIK